MSKARTWSVDNTWTRTAGLITNALLRTGPSQSQIDLVQERIAGNLIKQLDISSDDYQAVMEGMMKVK